MTYYEILYCPQGAPFGMIHDPLPRVNDRDERAVRDYAQEFSKSAPRADIQIYRRADDQNDRGGEHVATYRNGTEVAEEEAAKNA